MTASAAFAGLSEVNIAFAAVFTFIAAAIRGLTGFGMAIILVPLLGMVMRPEEAVVLAILLQLLIGPVGLPAILADSHRSSAMLIACLAMLATPFGLLALAHTPPDLARILIAAIALGAFVAVLLTRKAAEQPGLLPTWGVGIASGMLTGFAAMPGPPVIPYYLREAFSPKVARASMMLIFFGTAMAGTASAVLLGVATNQLALLAAFLFLPMLAGNWLGGKAFGRISPAIWRSVVALLLGVAGISACWRAFT